MKNIDRIVKHRERVNEMTRAQDKVTLEVASWFIPTGALFKVLKFKKVLALFKLKRGAQVAEVAAEELVVHGDEAAKAGKTIIGETMARVEAAAAKEPGSVILNDMPVFTGKPWQVTSQVMQYNRQWLLQQMRSGRTILDLGLDPSRKLPSIFYQMEQSMLKNYEKLHPGSLNVITP